MHLVLVEPIDGHGPERVEPDGQLHRGDPDPPLPQAGEHGLREVQSGGGGGRRHGPVGEDGLVAVGVVEGLGDVRGQGRPADLREHLEQGAVPGVGRHQPPPLPQVVADLDRQPRAGHDRARHQPLRWPYECLPPSVGPLLEEQHLDRTPRVTPAEEPRRQHPGVVDHHEIARREQLRQVADEAVLHPVTPVDQQAGRVPLLPRALGDGLGRQLVVDVGDGLGRLAHSCSSKSPGTGAGPDGGAVIPRCA